jgi:hypothetical protein
MRRTNANPDAYSHTNSDTNANADSYTNPNPVADTNSRRPGFSGD